MEDEEGEKKFPLRFPPPSIFLFLLRALFFLASAWPGAGRLDVNGVLWGWWGWKRSVGQLIFAQIHRQGRLA